MNRSSLISTAITVLILVGVAWRAPLVDCPLGFGGSAAALEHLCCESCGRTGKLTVVQTGRLFSINRGNWPTPKYRAIHAWRS